MSLREYLYDKKYLLAGCAAYLLLSEVVLNLFHSKIEEQVFLNGLFCLLAATGLFADYRKRKHFHENVQNTLDGLKEKYLLMEMIAEPEYLEARLMYQECVEILKSMNDEIARHERVSNEFKSYIETWIHEIKIPIASAGLMLHNRNTGAAEGASMRRLKEQLRRIEEDVEQVLYYIRGEVPENDYVIAVHSLKSIVQEAVRDQRDSLILHHFSVQVDIGEEEVRTDRKWLAFMLRQIISNAVKYAGADDGVIRFRCEKYVRKEQGKAEAVVVEGGGTGVVAVEDGKTGADVAEEGGVGVVAAEGGRTGTVVEEEGGSGTDGSARAVKEKNDQESGRSYLRLEIEDHGIGISEADLPRIFEKSFTGTNGRNTASTGMGLYICRRLCRELGHGIGAESVPGEYTRIWMDFPSVLT